MTYSKFELSHSAGDPELAGLPWPDPGYDSYSAGDPELAGLPWPDPGFTIPIPQGILSLLVCRGLILDLRFPFRYGLELSIVATDAPDPRRQN